MNQKHIVFLFPAYYDTPMGGYKVVYEYSNRLINDGYKVTIIYPSFLFFGKISLFRKAKHCLKFIYYLVVKKKGPYSWFQLDEKVELKFVYSLKEKNVPKADYYIATAMETAYSLNGYKNIDNKQKFYLIQAFEDWAWGREALLNTWRFDLKKVVISPWLQSVASEIGEKAILIENGVDRIGLKKIVEPEDRDKFTVLMLYHQQKLKGCDDGLKALKYVKDIYPQLKGCYFGCPARPLNLPEWIDYFQTPNENVLCDIYNNSAIFIGTSHSEGWGLTIGEAMSCGCAVACTNAGGYLAMAHNNETALVSDIGDWRSLAKNIIDYIENDEMRIRIARNGNDKIQMFTWDRAYIKFNSMFKE